MRKTIGSAVAALAPLASAPAMAAGVGIGGAVLSGTGTSSNSTTFNGAHTDSVSLDHTDSLALSHTDTLGVAFDSTIGASSGSGSVLDINLNGKATAQFQQAGIAGSYASLNGGNAVSLSGNIGGFSASTTGTGFVDGQVLNFGQSNVERTLAVDYSATNTAAFNAQNTASFDAANAANFSAASFDSLTISGAAAVLAAFTF